MRALRILPVICGILCLIAALGVFLADLLFIWRYGVDFCDAAFVTEAGDFADWPTGERPGWAFVPAWLYALPLVLVAATALALNPELGGQRNTGYRGCE
jgi:hypothetical protein